MTWRKYKLISVRNSNYNLVGFLECVYINLNKNFLIFFIILAKLNQGFRLKFEENINYLEIKFLGSLQEVELMNL